MARLPQLIQVAKKFDLKIISIKDLVAYRMKTETLVQKEMQTTIDTQYGTFKVTAYKQLTSGDIHIALHMGEIDPTFPTLVVFIPMQKLVIFWACYLTDIQKPLVNH